MEEQTDYAISELFMEVMADNSWEPDDAKRTETVMQLMMFTMFM
jgi:hypothetical protein